MSYRDRRVLIAAGLAISALVAAHAELPGFLQRVVSGTAIEAALYRAMDLPGVKLLYPRPPKEAQDELQGLIAKDSHQAELYSLRAMEDEQALDFTAAASDWKAYTEHAADPVAAKLELADFYHRRMQAADEVAVLMQVGSAPPISGETYVPTAQQRSWLAFGRIAALVADQAMDPATTERAYEAWLVRYAHEPAVYANYFNWLLTAKRYDDASALIVRYKTSFPNDAVFPTKATALVEFDRGSVDKAIAVYDAGYQPLWPEELINSYYGLLDAAHQERSAFAEAAARLQKDPDDLNALARIYFYQRHTGHADAAQAAINSYRTGKDRRQSPWTAEELYTLMLWMEHAEAWPEAARYAFALYNLPPAASLPSGRNAQETGLAEIVHILLTVPDQPIALGAHNLSMYRDIATLDQGPGYWNGILSLWLNSSSPGSEYHDEEMKAQPYFHRAKAAELLAMLDAKFPQAPERASLHTGLIGIYAEYGQDHAVIDAGNAYLQNFPHGAERVSVAMQMADAYARLSDTKDEFALYDRILNELGTATQGMPLTAAAVMASAAQASTAQSPSTDGQDTDTAPDSETSKPVVTNASQAFNISVAPAGADFGNAAEYSQVLERYVGRLSASGQMQNALAVLRKELDRNPNDPLLYERLAAFLEQNNLSAQQEELYKTAIARFPEKSWYDKLARFYIRRKQADEFAALTHQVTDTFAGTDLEAYFNNVHPSNYTHNGGISYQMAIELNLYAAKRFPHDMVFVRNLISLYSVPGRRDSAAVMALLREHWWQADDLRTRFFEDLSASGQLDGELAQLHGVDVRTNPAAGRELAEIQLWRSHFEESAAPLATLAGLYPADPGIGDTAVSIFRSLAYYDSTQTARAVAIENDLLAADPANADRLTTIGDIYADSGAAGMPGHEDLAAAAPYFRRLASLHPGSPDGYLQAATVFWDYFQFDDALKEIHIAREKFAQPALFGYEAGAICEGQRDDTCAVEEYVHAALAGNEEACERLLALAPRKAWSQRVDAAVAAAGSSEEAMVLREDVLDAENRGSEIGPLLESELARAMAVDDAAAIADRAEKHKLTLVREQALAREIALATDPVQKIELQYQLAQSQENRKDIADAARIIAAIYAANPRILGVVRNTVDFDWRTGARPQAITTLVDAAKIARPDLARQYTLEAASKANDAGEYAEARSILAPVLDASPFDPQLLALVANSYAQSGDNAGLRDLYVAKLAAIKSANLSADTKKQTTLLLRRGLIPALTHLKDYAGATDQYIAMLSAYPEDAGLITEASLYALRWQQKDRLVGFVQLTVTQSPKDSRFAAMLAQVDTLFEDYPAAVAAWTHAVQIRADRQDWFAAKADIELRLDRLDDACADYERLYVLSYKDAQWMVKEAEVRARQGRKDDAIAALQKAWMSGHAPTPEDAFRIADQLEVWNFLDDSRRFAEQGVQLAGNDLLVTQSSGASTYMRVMTRLRQAEPAVDTMRKALDAAKISPSSPTVIVEQMQKQGIASVTDATWRDKIAAQRAVTASQSFGQAMNAMAATVKTFYTPEEKSLFAALLDKEHPAVDLDYLAGAAGLSDREEAWSRQILMRGGRQGDNELQDYVQLQTSRMLFSDLARTLEVFAPHAAHVGRLALDDAAEAYRSDGDEANELRVRSSLEGASGVSERYLALLLKRDQSRLIELAGEEHAADAAMNYAVAHADESVALRALGVRGEHRNSVWRSSYRALVGLYFADTGSGTDGAFHTALGDDTIGERLANPADREHTLAGDAWYYYGTRYAVFRMSGGPGDAEDFAASQLEQNATLANFVALARIYADAGKTDAAIAEYNHALELHPEASSVHDAEALLLWHAGRRADAVAQWNAAIASLQALIASQLVPQDFFTEVPLVLRHARETGAMPQLQPALTALLKAYLAKNGNYRSNELLHAAFDAAPTHDAGLDWIVALSAASPQQAGILADLNSVPWLAHGVLEAYYLKRLELARSAPVSSDDSELSRAQITSLQASLVTLYVADMQDAKAKEMLAAMPADSRGSLVMERVLLASRDGTLQSLLDSYDALPDTAQPASDVLRNAAGRLAAAKDESNARLLLEFVFNRSMLRHQLTPPDFIALAEARIRTNDMPGALELLRRLTLQPTDGDAYSNAMLAAGLLEEAGHEPEAIPFLQSVAKAVPWNSEYALRLADAQLKADQDTAVAHTSLASVASAATTAYGLRSRAALDLQGTHPASLGSAELDLLSAGAATAQQARQPYFDRARMLAAGQLGSTAKPDAEQQASLLLEALAIAPTGENVDLVRAGIFHAEVALHNDAMAGAAAQPLRNSLDSGGSSAAWNGSAGRAALLAETAEVNWRLGNSDVATHDLQRALADAKDALQRLTWRQELTRWQAIQRRDALNEERRPQIHDSLSQDHAVRPRLSGKESQ